METQQTLIEQPDCHPNGQVRLFKAALGLRPDQEILLFNLIMIGFGLGYIAAIAVTVAIYYFFLQAASFAQYKFLELNQICENHIPGGGITVGLAFYTLLTIFILKVTPRRIWRTSLKCWGKGMTGAFQSWFLQKRRLDAVVNIGMIVLAHLVIVLALSYTNNWAFQLQTADGDTVIDVPFSEAQSIP